MVVYIAYEYEPTLEKCKIQMRRTCQGSQHMLNPNTFTSYLQGRKRNGVTEKHKSIIYYVCYIHFLKIKKNN